MKVHFKANVQQRLKVKVDHYGELASWGVLHVLGGSGVFQRESMKSVDAAWAGGSATTVRQVMTWQANPFQSALPYWALLTAPPASASPDNQTPHQTYQGDARAALDCEAAEWCWPSTLRCYFMLFCVLKSNSAKESGSDQLFCAQATLHKAQLIIMQKVRCYQALSASDKLLGVDNRSACHRTCSMDYSIQFFLQTFFSGVVWSEVIHNHIN